MNDVFRFIKIRAAQTAGAPTPLLKSQWSTALGIAREFAERRTIANRAMRADRPRLIAEIDSLHHGRQINDALRVALANPAAKLRELVATLGSDEDIISRATFEEDRSRLSDTLLLSRYATESLPADLPTLRRLYLVYHFLWEARSDASLLEISLVEILASPLLPPFDTSEEASRPRIASVGVADLLVVKQQITRYETTEIAHVENIMSGETRSREHRVFERIDDSVTLEREKFREQEKELQTEERFELNKEASRTIKEDQKYAFDLSVSARYGPTVEVDSSFALDIEASIEASAKTASSYAKDVVERSLERVTDRVREERVRTIRRETEEKNLHQFVNGDDQPHKVGIYQFLDKIYEAQVFNYGKRQIFDLLIPEPASYLWFLSERTDSETLTAVPVAPESLNIAANELLYEISDADLPNYYLRLAQKYGATAINPPPEANKIATMQYQTPQAGSPRASEEGEALSPPVTFEVAIEAGYEVVSAEFHGIAMSDDGSMLKIPFSVGGISGEWVGLPVLEDHGLTINSGSVTIPFSEPPMLSSGNKLIFTAIPYETANYTLSATVRCKASETLIDTWKISTYESIREAYATRLLEYKDEVTELEVEQKQKLSSLNVDVGLPPSKRKQLILSELKKHCIGMFMGHWFDGTAVRITDGAWGPTYSFDEAISKGNLIRFLEQSIEWSQLQYALYPYFWSRQEKWKERVRKDDADYEFQQFMQAGAARVVLAVRPGFEAAFCHFLETGEPWNGTGTPPAIHDPIYVSIVDELRELAGGALATPEPMGEAWEVRLPTNLVMLRRSSTLPAWEKMPHTDWSWRPITEDA